MGRPLFFQSKLLCFSLLYLFSSLFLALYTSLSSTKCLFRSSPFDPVQTPLFSYPNSYGEHKYAIPITRESCDSPVFFSDYWDVLREIQDLCRNSTPANVMYMQGKADWFGGNFSTHERVSYFDHQDDQMEVPCGFFKEFPISNSDRMAMKSCKGVVVISAIFGDHDKIRQPKGLGTQTQQTVSFFMFVDDSTLKGLNTHNLITLNSTEYYIGAWRLICVSTITLYQNPTMNGVIPKYLVHRLFPNSKFSIWVDAKLQLMVDPLLLIHSLVVLEDVDMAISKHPFYVHTMEEAMAIAKWKKWGDVEGLKTQMETYCENGLRLWTPNKHPYTSDVPNSALIIRRHGVTNNLFSCLLFNELNAFNPRDQLTFTYVRDKMNNPRIKINMFELEVFEQIAVEYRHNLKHVVLGEPTPTTNDNNVGSTRKRPSFDSSSSLVNGSLGKCEDYLMEKWGESH